MHGQLEVLHEYNICVACHTVYAKRQTSHGLTCLSVLDMDTGGEMRYRIRTLVLIRVESMYYEAVHDDGETSAVMSVLSHRILKFRTVLKKRIYCFQYHCHLPPPLSLI